MANKRLIDANALLNWLEECTDKGDWLVSQYNADWIWSMLDSAPTIDAVEVVHARKAESAISETGLVCTACHSDIDRDAVFCKYCGAKMDGGNEDVNL